MIAAGALTGSQATASELLGALAQEGATKRGPAQQIGF